MAKPNFSALLENDSNNTEIAKTDAVGGDVSNLVKNMDGNNTNELNVKLIPRRKIAFHKENDYAQDNIESLAKSILEYDIQNIPSGYYDEEADLYIVENGERRTRALDLLINTYKDFEDTGSVEYKCYETNIAKYEKGYPFRRISKREMDKDFTRMDEIDSELRLIDANEEARSSEGEKRAHILKKLELTKEKNTLLNKGTDVVKLIATQEDISVRQAYKYNAAESLIPDLKELFVKTQITLNDSEFYSKLTEDEQKMIVELIVSGSKGNAQELYALQQELQKVEDEKQQFILEYEQKIRDLENEKALAEGSLKLMKKAAQQETEESIKILKVQLKEEYDQLNKEHTEEQVTKVKTMESEVKKAEQVNEHLQKSFEEERLLNNNKQNEIEQLQQKMEELQKADTKLSESEIRERVKAEIAYNLSLESLRKGIKDLKNVVPASPSERDTLITDIDSLINSLTGIRKNLDN